MIPNAKDCYKLWDKYKLPDNKRVHSELVAKVAVWLAKKLMLNCPPASNVGLKVDTNLLLAAGLLHDIDKNVEKFPGERHPDAGVRILFQEGMKEVADLVKIHSLHSIINPTTTPTSWEEKILYLSDKLIKYEVIGVDDRFKLWNNEHLPQEEQDVLDQSYPKVKQLEKEIFTMAQVNLQILKTEIS